MAEEIIYVQLLNEGTPVYRPVPATCISEKIFILHGEDIYSPEIEDWEFTPGTKVLTEERNLSSGAVLVAIEAIGTD